MMGYLIESFAVIQVLKEVCIQALPFLFCLSCFGSIPKVIKIKKTLAEEVSDEKQDIYYNNNVHPVNSRMQWTVLSVKISQADQEEP